MSPTLKRRNYYSDGELVKKKRKLDNDTSSGNSEGGEKAEISDEDLAISATKLALEEHTTVKCYDKVQRTFRFSRALSQLNGLTVRGTLVIEAECIEDENFIEGESWIGRAVVLKFNFPTKGKIPEDVLINHARAHAKRPDQTWALNHLPAVLGCIDTKHTAKTTLRGWHKELYRDDYKERVIHVTVLEKLEPLMELKSAEEFAQVFYDILQIHKWLHDHPKILHRDLSMNNIMFRRIDGKVYGVLNDFDLSSYLADMNGFRTSNCGTGTRPFMAYELLNDKGWQRGHMYRHDLESLFYVMLILCCDYEKPNALASESEQSYSEWFNGNDDHVATKKGRFLFNVYTGTLPVRPYFEGFKDWLSQMYYFLRRGFKARPLPEEKVEFDWGTWNGNVTYEKMLGVMSAFKGNPLQTRTLIGNADS